MSAAIGRLLVLACLCCSFSMGTSKANIITVSDWCVWKMCWCGWQHRLLQYVVDRMGEGACMVASHWCWWLQVRWIECDYAVHALDQDFILFYYTLLDCCSVVIDLVSTSAILICCLSFVLILILFLVLLMLWPVVVSSCCCLLMLLWVSVPILAVPLSALVPPIPLEPVWAPVECMIECKGYMVVSCIYVLLYFLS